MRHHQIDLAVGGQLERRTGPGADVANADSGFFFELIFQRSHNAGVDRSDRTG